MWYMIRVITNSIVCVYIYMYMYLHQPYHPVVGGWSLISVAIQFHPINSKKPSCSQCSLLPSQCALTCTASYVPCMAILFRRIAIAVGPVRPGVGIVESWYSQLWRVQVCSKICCIFFRSSFSFLLPLIPRKPKKKRTPFWPHNYHPPL